MDYGRVSGFHHQMDEKWRRHQLPYRRCRWAGCQRQEFGRRDSGIILADAATWVGAHNTGGTIVPRCNAHQGTSLSSGIAPWSSSTGQARQERRRPLAGGSTVHILVPIAMRRGSSAGLDPVAKFADRRFRKFRCVLAKRLDRTECYLPPIPHRLNSFLT